MTAYGFCPFSNARAARHGQEKSFARCSGVADSAKYAMNAPHAASANAMLRDSASGVVSATGDASV